MEYIQELEKISLLKLIGFLESQDAFKRPKGFTKRQCIWLIEEKAIDNSKFCDNLKSFVFSETGLRVEKEEPINYEFQQKALENDTVAQNFIGDLYRVGRGVEKDPKIAVAWYLKAANKGDVTAQCKLGVCYNEGIGVDIERQTAFHWFQRAAQQGDGDAQYKLGWCYSNGDGVEKSRITSLTWYLKSALQGHPVAQFNMGVFYENGDGVERNTKMSFDWYKKAARQGDVDAQYFVGEAYHIGNGVEKSFDKAFRWYKRSADQGDEYALTVLGQLYLDGTGTNRDLKKAFECWQTATTKGYPKATQKLKAFQQKENLYPLLSQEWPKTHLKLHKNCRNIVLELSARSVFGAEWVPDELLWIIVKYLVQLWPENDAHSPYN